MAYEDRQSDSGGVAVAIVLALLLGILILARVGSAPTMGYADQVTGRL